MRLRPPTGPSALLFVMCAAACGALGLASCAEVPAVTEGPSQFTGTINTETAQQGVRLQTRFVLVGVDGVQADFGLKHLAIHVGALLLDPAEGGATTFASREPFSLAFDVEAGRTDISGPEIALPHAGDFFVALQVEPASVAGGQSGQGSGALDPESSVVASGYCGHVDALGMSEDEKKDEPSPLPWQPKSSDELENVREFTYRSDSVARLQLGEVQLRQDGAYELLLTINVSDWLRESVIPVVETQARLAENAAGADDAPEVENPNGNAVLDVDGASTRSLIGDIGVGTRRF